MKRGSSKLLVLGILAALVFLLGLPALRLGLYATRPLDGARKDQVATLEVKKGILPTDLAKALKEAGAIEDVAEFVRLGRLLRQWGKVKAGEYRVSPSQSPIELFSVITSGVSAAYPVTVKEGANMYEIADAIAARGLAKREDVLKLCRDREFMRALGVSEASAPSLEGFLFPETYFFNRSLSPREMLSQMVKHFSAVWKPEWDGRAKELGLSRYQVVTLASVIEKETGAPQDRPLISSVFHNRLKLKMRLQSDPTTIYGIWERYRGNIHRSDLQSNTPFNTYVIPALPVGPISNPGREAMHAALFPAETKFLYFVSHNDGTTHFSSTLAEHNAAVQKYQVDPAARSGKSWRDLSKTPGP